MQCTVVGKLTAPRRLRGGTPDKDLLMSGWGLKSRILICCLLLVCCVIAVSVVQLWHAGSHCVQAAQVATDGGGPSAVNGVIFRLWMQGAVVWLAVALVAVFAAILAACLACTPLDDLVESVVAIAEGDWSRRASEEGPVETATIGRAVNRMAEQLASRSAEEVSQLQERGAESTQELRTQLLLRAKVEDELRTAKEAAERAAEDLRITNRQLMEDLKEVERAVTRAEVANQVKSEFLADMSHGIRTPLTSILGFADALLDPTLSKSERLDGVGTIKRNGEALLAVVNDIVDFSRIAAGTLDVNHQVCSLFEVVADVQTVIAARAIGKKLRFDVDYIGEFPATIQTDPARLRQILIDVLSFAVDHTDVGGVRLTAQFSDCELEPMLVFESIDTGTGMEGAAAQRLLTPYGDGSVERESGREGIGLSLAIGKQLANLLGGDLTVESVPDQGSVFRLAIATGPLDGVEMVDGQAQAIAIGRDRMERHSVSAERTLEARVLLAEDGPDNQRLISRLLAKAGAEVVCVSDGREALDACRRALAEGRPFHVVLMDMEMPRMDGYTATSLLRGEGYDRPILALTAHAMAGDREKCVHAGCDDYVSKPVDRLKLIEIIIGWVGRRSDRVPAGSDV